MTRAPTPFPPSAETPARPQVQAVKRRVRERTTLPDTTLPPL